MITTKNLNWRVILYYTWRNMLYYFLLSVFVFLLHDYFKLFKLHLPFSTITALSTALAIFLGFKNNNAYDRWWEARQVWGLLVNYSRAWARQVITLIIAKEKSEEVEVRGLQKQIIYRHIGFVHALRVFLRKEHAYNYTRHQGLF